MEEYLQDIFHQSHSEGEMKVKMANLSSMIQFADTLRKDDVPRCFRRKSINILKAFLKEMIVRSKRMERDIRQSR